jgi:hypothetical protein
MDKDFIKFDKHNNQYYLSKTAFIKMIIPNVKLDVIQKVLLYFKTYNIYDDIHVKYFFTLSTNTPKYINYYHCNSLSYTHNYLTLNENFVKYIITKKSNHYIEKFIFKNHIIILLQKIQHLIKIE